ncbi:MAG: DNA translocase FtsK [Eubacteriales bacterium]|nr:DNA translocase FtsK [Eubacteriales bacterium]
MAVSKNSKGKRGSTKSTKSTRSANANSKSASTGFQTEIILLLILAASIILLISNFGMGGFVGNAISSFCFGAIGLMAYVFPVLLFVGAAFLMSNRKNHLAYKKVLASIVFLVFLCGILQLLTEGYMKSTTLLDYYNLCSSYRTGGGIVGGAVCISTTSAFGVWGGYVIMLMVILVCLILITQRSFFGFISKIGMGIYGLFKGGHDRYMEGQPEREMKRELRAREKRQKREERQAERLRELEEALAEDGEDVPESGEKKKKLSRHGFLDETKLEPHRQAEQDISGAAAAPLEKEPGSVDTVESQQGQIEFKIQRSEPAAMPEDAEDEMPDDRKTDASEEEEPAGEPAEDIFSDAFGEAAPVSSGKGTSGKRTAAERSAMSGEEKTRRQSPKNPKSSQNEIESGIVNIRHEINQQEAPVKKVYQYPPLKLLKRGDGKSQGDSDEYLRKTAQKLQDTLHNFGVNVTVTNVSCGPTVTRYELQPEQGVKVSRIVGLADDIKLNLATPDIRIEAPIPGKAAVGIEVPNKENSPVMLRDLLQSQEFQGARSKLSFAVGKDIAGKPVVTDIAKMPHLLIAGATGSGKSVCINTLIVSILYKASPEEVKLIMIDPKVVELSVYNGIPHLFIPVVTDPKKAAGALNWAVSEMMSRYNTFAEYNVRNLGEYNKKIENMRIPEGEEAPAKMPQIVIIVDELADLMMVAPGEVEDAICRLAQLARAAGIHLVIATQRPSVNVITGLIKANMPSRIAFSVSSGVDSRTILDMNGAEKLLGKGDMLFYPQGYQKPARLQGAFVSDEEVSGIVEFLSDKNPAAEYDKQIEQQMNTAMLSGASAGGGDERDVYFEEAGKFIIEKEKASIGMLQRMFKIGFNRAARIMDQLCDAGVVGPEEGTKPRKVLMTQEEFQNYIEESL